MDEFERINHDPVTALIPEQVSLGVYATEVVIFYGESETAIDFIQGIVKPYRIASRVILNNNLAKRFFKDLKEEMLAIGGSPSYISSVKNISNESSVKNMSEEGEADNKSENKSEDDKIEDIYDQLKIVNEQLSGVYANKILLVYGKDTFCMDFISNIYPKSIVVSRVFMSVNRTLELLGALKKIYNS